MPLENFGSILTFAAQLEELDSAFYAAAAANPNCAQQKSLFEDLAAKEKKTEKNVLRARRENVTEMILEPIKDFTRDPFVADREGAENMSPDNVFDAAFKIEEKAVAFYSQAAEKLKALPEISRTLKTLSKKRAQNRESLKSAAS